MSISNPVPTAQQSPWLVPATVTPCAAWNAKMAAYLRIDALTRAYEEFGDGARLSEKAGLQDLRLETQFGANFRNIPAARAILDSRSAEMRAAEEATTERFYRPLWAAQRELALTPAPTMAAALFKADMIEVAEVWNDNQMARDCFEIMAEDMARLAISDPDAEIVAAWERRQIAYAAYNAQPTDQPGLEPGEMDTPEEKRLWAIIDEAEKVIHSSTATTLRGVSIQLWTSLYHSVSGREDDAAITIGDIAKLSRVEAKLDWNAKLALAALRSLAAMGAA